ncbi:MAG: AsmA family protein [Myxococcaceae bacterium]|nr:AsmA family protein [Myxococcaceae bacterium]
MATQMETRRKRWPFVVGGVVLLGVAVVMGVRWRLDAFLLERARVEAAALSQTLGRTVEVGNVRTQLLPDVGVQVEDVVVGPAEGEEVPLLSLGKLDVGVALGPLLRSKGTDIQVTQAEARELTLQVVRLPDGTTNVQRLQEKLAAQDAKEPQAQDAAEAPLDLSRVRVDRLALVDGVIRLVDQTRPKAQPLSISDIDVEVKDLKVGAPLTAQLDAAVLAERQNLHLTLEAAPLPPTLMPVPERLVLRAEPIDLSPLGPFLPPDVGLKAGTLQADWTAELGGAVPGGSGPTRLKGGLTARGLRFAQAEGGRALDVVVETDVTADVVAGSLALDVLKVQAGPARLTGQGRVSGLLTDTPEVKDFQLVGQGLDPAALAAYYPPLRALAQQVSGPVGLTVRGGGNEAAQALVADVELTPVRLRIPDQLTKEAGAPMHLTARLSGAPATGGALRFDTRADLTGVDLRPGELLDKAPGQRLEVAAAGTYQPARGKGAMKVDVPKLTVHVRDSTLAGSASAALQGEGKAGTTTFALDMKSPRLDADALMLGDDELAARKGQTPEAFAAAEARAPAKNPARFDGYRGDMRFEVGNLRYEDTELSNLVAHVKMVDDQVTVERLTTGVYGGMVDASGTRVKLGPEQRPFALKAQVKGVNVANALSGRVPEKVLRGSFSGDVDLTGVGFTLDSLKQNLVGGIHGTLVNGLFEGTDVVGSVSQPLAKALPFAAKALNHDDVTRLAEELPFGVTIKDGVAQLKRPITWTRPEGAMAFSGGIRLDGTLELAGEVKLAPTTIRTITLGKVLPAEPIPVALRLTGPAWKPQVTGLDVRPAVALIAKQAAVGAASKLLGEKGKVAGELVTGGADAAKALAQKEADARRKELEEQARQEAERARKRLEEQAKKRLKGLFGG